MWYSLYRCIITRLLLTKSVLVRPLTSESKVPFISFIEAAEGTVYANHPRMNCEKDIDKKNPNLISFMINDSAFIERVIQRGSRRSP